MLFGRWCSASVVILSNSNELSRCHSDFHSEHHKEKRRKRANTWYKSSEEVGGGSDKHTCRTRYQQTPVEVYARFIAVDQV